MDLSQIANAVADHYEHQEQEFSQSPSSSKRKAEDNAQPAQRTKRNRYISIACNECKRRKIKCNGQTPCQRCGNLRLECIYAPNCCNGFKDSQEYKDMSQTVALLQEQVNALYHDLQSLRGQLGYAASTGAPSDAQQTPIDPNLQNQNGAFKSPYSPSMSRPKAVPRARQPSFRGPTSAEFNFGVAKSSLRTMGITGNRDGTETNSGAITAEPSPVNSPGPIGQILPTQHASKDPIWRLSQNEALRLCHVYEDEMGLMYPVLDVERLIAYSQKLFSFMDAARHSGLMQQGFPGADTIDDDDTNLLKVVLATAMVTEGGGSSELGVQLFEYVQPAIDNMLLGSVGVKGVRLLTIAAMFEFQRDNEGTSWRIVGLVARVCIELGLHRRETYEAIEDNAVRMETIRLFWSIYVLDRRWSFGTGMPFAIQDSDIDPNLPKPEDSSPYLSAMIQYSAIGSKVWRTVGAAPGHLGGAVDTEQMNFLDYQVMQWLRNVPPQLQYEQNMQEAPPSTPGPSPARTAHRLRILLYLRANQMRILIHRPVLYTATSIMQNRKQAETVVDVAKDTIRVLTHINQSSDLYRSQQMLFNAFLTAALAVLFLAVSHTPVVFAENVREEFYMALELVRGFSKGSLVGKRLWRAIRILKEVGPKLGLRDSQNQSTSGKNDLDPSRSAAVAMAGLAGHNVDETALFSGDSQRWSMASLEQSNTSPGDMAKDLTSLFEAAGGLQALGDSSGLHNGSGMDAHYGGLHSGEGVENGSALFGGDEGLSNILKELF